MRSFADSPHAGIVLFFVSFSDASFSPIPGDTLYLPLALSSPKKSYKFSEIATAGSVIGGLFGYIIGYFLMNTIGYDIVEFYNAQQDWEAMKEAYRGDYGMVFLAGAAFSPIPYKIATIAAGAVQMDLWPFLLISAVGRGARYFAFAFFIYKFREKVQRYIKKYFNIFSIIFVIVVVLGFVIVKYWF